MKKLSLLIVLFTLYLLSPINSQAAKAVLLGWNNLGMHCMDSRYAEFSILPPYNTIDAQLIVDGKLVTADKAPLASGYTLTYEAVADPLTAVKNSTSADLVSANSIIIKKSDWATFAPSLFPGLKNLNPPYMADIGLAGCNMPGINNIPQPLAFKPANAPINTFQAEGIPITPVDDMGNKNTYPMMRLVARDLANKIVAQSDIVLPVSDEMSCKNCHGANTNPNANPNVDPKVIQNSNNGWIIDANPDREYRLNILKLHDQKEFSKNTVFYSESLSAKGINAQGLYASATEVPAKPVLCASCHASEALGTPSFTSPNGAVPALTASVHSTHKDVTTPGSSLSLDNSANRSACYECHPGSKTRCLRGAMGSAVAADGSMEMQCQSCHGNMSKVGASTRTGWVQEPNCQTCHTGTATNNNGMIRYTSVFNNPSTYDAERVAVNQTFATNPNTPALGLSLYRFSKGHGDLQCSACHGSTHAEFPSSHQNDNIRNEQLQGHAGVTVECEVCHTTGVPSTVSGGPHGLHPLNQTWVNQHHDVIEKVGINTCKNCHGSDLKGTELSRVQGDRSFNLGDSRGTQQFYRGATVGCYTCHKGADNDSMNTTPAPVTQDVSGTTYSGRSIDITLPIDVNTGLTFRVLQQPENGTVGIKGNVATYFPFDGFTGTDTFKFAGYNGSKNTNTLNKGVVAATGTVTVLPIPPTITVQPSSQTVIAGSTVIFSVTASGSNPINYQWIKDGTPIPGAVNSTLSLSNVTLASSGKYQVHVSNSAGNADSLIATLAVQQAPIITTQPTSQNVIQGSNVNFRVITTGYPAVTYQWYKNNAELIAGATKASFSISSTSLTDAGNYYVVVTNTLGSVTSSIVTLTVKPLKADSKTSVVSNLNPSTKGTAILFTASVTGNNPSGEVTFKEGATILGSGTLSGGIVTYTTTSLSVGIHSITASYSGDDNNTASVSGIFSQTVNKVTTTTNLTSDPNPSTKNQLVTFSAVVTGGSNPTGSVTFKDGTSIMGRSTLSGGIATYKTSRLTRNTHSITATYQGDNSNTASASATLSQIVK